MEATEAHSLLATFPRYQFNFIAEFDLYNFVDKMNTFTDFYQIQFNVAKKNLCLHKFAIRKKKIANIIILWRLY